MYSNYLYGTICYKEGEFIKYILPAALKINEEVKCIPRYKALRIKTSCEAKEKKNPSIESSERIPFGKKKNMWQTASSSYLHF